jgi:DNA-binding NarL/FixJ family response regulator
MTPHATALIVEDHPIYRDGLLLALARGLPRLRFAAAGSVSQALAQLEAADGFELLVADQRLPDGEGLTLLATARQRWPTQVAVLVSGQDDAVLAARAQSLGCLGFLPKALEPMDLVRRIGLALEGEPQFPSRPRPGSAAARLIFTERQLCILSHLARGHSSRVIAEALGISERTVKDHLSVIFGRLDASTRAEAVARAMALGVLAVEAGA